MRQAAHFRSHHRKAPALLARAGGLDGRVQCQDVGLEGNAVDQLRDFADAARRRLNLVHGVCHAVDGLAAALSCRSGLRGQRSSLAGRLCSLAHRTGDFFHRGSRLLQVAGLRLGAG